jgi:hypothetical protein
MQQRTRPPRRPTPRRSEAPRTRAISPRTARLLAEFYAQVNGDQRHHLRVIAAADAASPIAAKRQPRLAQNSHCPTAFDCRGDKGAPVGSPTRRQTTAARYAGGEHGVPAHHRSCGREGVDAHGPQHSDGIRPGEDDARAGGAGHARRRSLRSLRPCPATGPARHRPRACRASARGRSGTALAPALARPYRSSLLSHLDIRLLAASVLTVVPTV